LNRKFDVPDFDWMIHGVADAVGAVLLELVEVREVDEVDFVVLLE
jgi:hypothetical protein